MKTSVSINFTEAASGKKGQRAITDINPDATSAQIKTFAQALNGITTNNYVETNRIQTINVDTESVPVPASKATGTLQLKENPTIAIEGSLGKIPLSEFIINGQTVTDLPGTTISIFGVFSRSAIFPVYFMNSSPDYICINFGSSETSGTGTLYLALQETDEYTAATMTTTITIS